SGGEIPGRRGSGTGEIPVDILGGNEHFLRLITDPFPTILTQLFLEERCEVRQRDAGTLCAVHKAYDGLAYRRKFFLHIAVRFGTNGVNALAEIHGQRLKLAESPRYSGKHLDQSVISEFRFAACRFQPFFHELQGSKNGKRNGQFRNTTEQDIGYGRGFK